MSEPKKTVKKPSGKIVQPERAKANAFPFAYTAVTNPETGATYFKRVVSPQIPDRILMTGNKKELEKFYHVSERAEDRRSITVLRRYRAEPDRDAPDLGAPDRGCAL